MPSRYNRYYDVCRMSGSFCSHSSDCIGILNGSSFYLPGSSFRDDRATQTAIQKMKNCSDFFASECLDLLQKAVDWSISFAAGSDARKTAFLQDISQGKDKEFLRDVLNTYRSNHESADLRGHCGYSIGSREYLNYVERKVLLVTGAALDALELYQTVESDLHDADRKIGKKTYSAVAGIGGSWGLGALGAKGGAAAGAAIGTAIMPGVGTAIGGAVGGLVLGIAGSYGGNALGRWVVDITAME